ncbi:MAG: response regulator [Deltaproteobacteria bacterium]|nr:response regulator [Deltaproteobacteria bacterium]
MLIFPLISLFSAIICLSVGIFVYFNSRKRLVHKLFWVLCLFNAYWGLVEFMTRQSGDIDTALFWVRVGAFVILTVPVALHFVMAYTDIPKFIRRWWTWIILYAPALLSSLAILFTDKIFSGVTKMYWGYTLIYAPSSPVRNLFFVSIGSMGILAIIVSIVHYFRLKDRKEKMQALFVALGCLTPIVLANATQGMITTLMHFPIPPLTVPAAALQEIFIGYAIWRYDLFSLNPATAAENIVSTMSDLLILLRPEGRIVSVNRAVTEVLGFRKEELFRASLSNIMPHEVAQFLLSNPRVEGTSPVTPSSIPNQGIRYMETSLKAKDGTIIPASIAVSVLTEKDSSIAGYVVIARDITDQKKTEKALREAIQMAEAANRSKSEFLANMSHEIRTPMNGILGMTELTLHTDLTPEQREYLEIVKISGDSLLAIINDILDFSKIEARKLNLDQIDFDLRHTLEDVMDIMALKAYEAKLILNCRILPDVPTALIGDPVRIRQVIVNLVGNAIKFTKQGEILIQVRTENEEGSQALLHFSVSDTGVGIAPDKLNAIFESFEQADGSISREYGGTGLGLAICKQLAHLMGGEIWVESELGKGSTFHFTACFPINGTEDIDRTVLNELNLSDTPILIVDDNQTNRFVLREMVATWGLKPSEASSGEDAILKTDTAYEAGKPYQVVLLDRAMPGMDGFTVAARIKERKSGQNLKIILLTSIGEKGDAARCREMGISGYLMKPVKQADLLDALKIIMGLPKKADAPLITRHTVREVRSRLNILLAEDNLINQKLAIKLLEKRGHRVTVAGNGEEAVKAVGKNRFDILLMDVEMPKMNGIQATQAIREKEKGMGEYHIPIVAMTAHALRGDKERFIAAGMDGYVSKPIQVAELFSVIDEVTHSNPCLF